MKKKLEEYLGNYKKTYVLLDEIMKIYDNSISYSELARIIKSIEKNGGIEPVKKSGLNNMLIPLYYKYRINKPYFHQSYYTRLYKKQWEINLHLSLEDYFTLNETIFNKDEFYIDLISNYINNNPDMIDEKFIPELSFDMVGDEKWIQDKGGEAILKRLHLWDKLLLFERIEPLSFAINKNKCNEDIHYHLIIENKTPFLHLINYINESKYTTIIYGKGWQIISSIKLLNKQLNIKGENIYEYFGDMDNEGLSIFDSLTKKINVKPAVNYYKAMMNYKSVKGKENQKINEAAIDNFLSYFTNKQQDLIKKVLKDKEYYPQEILSKNILCKTLKG
ncbi:DUF2220 family protein [Vallitalea sediminicola]